MNELNRNYFGWPPKKLPIEKYFYFIPKLKNIRYSLSDIPLNHFLSNLTSSFSLKLFELKNQHLFIV